MPVAKAVTVALALGVLTLGNRMRRAFNTYFAALYLALALLQNAANTDTYGLVILWGNLILILVVALLLIGEAVAERNDFRPRRIPWWRWWVVPPALFALLAPIDTATMSPDLAPLRLLTSESALTCCMVTPVALAVLTLRHATVNPALLRVSSFIGVLLGTVNLIVWFALSPWAWWMGVLHLPLFTISMYGYSMRWWPESASGEPGA